MERTVLTADADDLLSRGVAEIIDADKLRHRLKTGGRLRVKLGIDPSKPALHIGHALTLRKLRQFQDAGHTAVVIMGDITAQLGDPTDRETARPRLSAAEVKANSDALIGQIGGLIDVASAEIHANSEWFGEFDLVRVVELMAKTTLNHLLSHETFVHRLEKNQPLYFHEALYPLLQGYDSTMVRSDVELGGIDQKFNVLMGRHLQRTLGQAEQDVLLVRYLPGTDGREKMSKSLGNSIDLTDLPDDIFGKTMAIPDRLILPYFVLATQVSSNVIETYRNALAKQENPREIKFALAKTIVGELKGAAAAEAAAERFNAVFRDKTVPADAEILTLPAGQYSLLEVLTRRTTLAPSNSAARRLVAQRGVKKNGRVVEDVEDVIAPNDGDTVVIQVGSRRFVKITWKTPHEAA